MFSDYSPSFAIVGSGPSGCYTAQFLRRAFPDSLIKMFDRLPVPFGLLRYGVAPDHVGTKAISSQFERLFERDGVKFEGGIEIGVSTSLEELRQEFDVVVLAIGLSQDRPLSIPGWALPGVYGSGQITRLFNGHPDEDLECVSVGDRLVIVGNGNVAIDLARLSLLGSEKLVEFGVEAEVSNTLSSQDLRQVHLVGRSLVGAAKFDVAMINELAKLHDVRFRSDAVEPINENPEAHKRYEAISKLVRESNLEANRVVNFHFGWTPSLIGGDGDVEFIDFASQDGLEKLTIPTQTIFSAIGFVEHEDSVVRRESLMTDETDLTTGFLSDGLYCVGWFRRGPQGTIPANRSDAKLVSDQIIMDLKTKASKRSGRTNE